jgi:hypothetical protein
MNLENRLHLPYTAFNPEIEIARHAHGSLIHDSAYECKGDYQKRLPPTAIRTSTLPISPVRKGGTTQPASGEQ